MLSGLEIKKQIKNGNIIIVPFSENQLNPNSYNIKLGNKLLVYDIKDYLDSKKENKTKEIIIPEEGYILEPGLLYLGETEEYTETIGFVPCIDGRSSIGRLGIQVHATAGFGDNGFKGKWTLEIITTHRVKIYTGMEIGQIYYETLEGDKSMIYSGKYQNQNSVIASRMNQDFNKDK